MTTRISSPVDANGRDTGLKRQTQGPSAHQGHASDEWPLFAKDLQGQALCFSSEIIHGALGWELYLFAVLPCPLFK